MPAGHPLPAKEGHQAIMKGIFIIGAPGSPAAGAKPPMPFSPGKNGFIDKVYPLQVQKELAERVELFGLLSSAGELPERREQLKQVEVIFSTWGMLPLDAGQIKTYFPSLRAVFYAAGSVQYFARPFLESGVRVFSAASANAVPVAEFSAAQIVLANKGFYQAGRLYQCQGMKAARDYTALVPGNFGAKVGILGAGMIGRQVIRLLHSYRLELLVFDPFLPEEKAQELGVQKAELPQIFAECQTISNHLANNAQTRGMLGYPLFSLMKPGATFINTGRGAQVVEEGLIRALREEPGRTAVLDVTDPEPVPEGHPFLSLPNVVLTPHIAGSMADELGRMGQYMRDAFQSYQQGAPSPYEVTLPMLETMA